MVRGAEIRVLAEIREPVTASGLADRVDRLLAYLESEGEATTETLPS